MTPQPTQPNSFGPAIAMGVLVGILFGVVAVMNSCSHTASSSTVGPATDQAASNWSYSATVDELHGPKQFASVLSDNQQGFGGATDGSLLHMAVEARPDGSHSIGFTVQGGGGATFSCGGNTDFTIKIDDGTPAVYSCHGSEGMTGVAYMDDPEGLLAALRTSKRMLVEPLFVVDGTRQFTFATAGLKDQADWR